MKKKLPVIFLTFANDKVDDALYLRNLPKELHGIRTALDKAVKAGLCELIERTAATVDDIFDTFQDPRYKDRIAMFHYGGHASGTQLMLETLDGGHGTSHSDGLMPFLGRQKGLQVAFFNGCSSQQQALELSEAGVPAVIGTATAIKDEVATELASRFYNGIASGSTIYQSWLEAIDILKTKNDTKKRKGLKLRRNKNSNDFPWSLYIREGAEIVKEWNLPSAAQNPLFGLPKLPKMNLPEEPFRFLRRYEPEHAEIFFGRDRYIRQLYDRISSEKAAPVILFYGQSGAGKSSALASGLLPRLEREADVKYVRRNPDIGLLGTLDKALGGSFKSAVIKNDDGTTILVSDIKNQIQQLEAIKDTLVIEEQNAIQTVIVSLQKRLEQQNIDIDNENTKSRLECWKSIEAETGRPFHILLDQVEEVFTRFNPDIENELEHLLLEIQEIFTDPNHAPKGKIILSYRKEYHPEIEEFCKKLQIPREGIFLKKLEKEDIVSVVNGVSSTEDLRQRYQITVEPELAQIIADDLLEDKDSPIAPVLSILLTKLWQLSKKEETSIFSIAQYQSLKKEGILMDDFFHQQMEKLRKWKPEIEESGLALDVLNYHTTALGTAGSQSVEVLRERYQHQSNEIDELLTQFKELYLLTDAGAKKTGLAHDTLAPIVIKEIRNSDKSGQRALRILTGKANEFKDNKENLLDNTDLKLVEDGEKGMRLWSSLEKELVKASQKRRAKQKALRRNLIITGIAAVLAIIGLSFWSYQESLKAKKNELVAESSTLAAQAILKFNHYDYKQSTNLAKEALEINPNNVDAYSVLLKSKYNHIYELDSQYYSTPLSLNRFENLKGIQFSKDISAPTRFAGYYEKNGKIDSIIVSNGQEDLLKIRVNNEEIKHFQIAPNGKYLGVLKRDTKSNRLEIWDIEQKEVVHEKESISAFEFSVTSKYLAYSDKKKRKTFIFNMETQKMQQAIDGVLYMRNDLNNYNPNLNYKVIDRSFLFLKNDEYFKLENIVYDLKTGKEIIRGFESISENGSIYTQQVELPNPNPESDGLGIFSVSDNQEMFIAKTLSGNNRQDAFITSDGKYSIEHNYYFDEYSNITITNIFFKEVLSIQAERVLAYRSKEEQIALKTGKMTSIYNLRTNKEQTKAKLTSIHDGKCVDFSIDGEYLITQFEENYFHIYKINQNETFLDAGKPFVVLSGVYRGISADKRYIATENSVYDLKSKKISSFNLSPNYFSEDGKYIIKDETPLEEFDNKELKYSFSLYDIKTQKEVDIDKNNYFKNTWQPYRNKIYVNILRDDENPNQVSSKDFNEDTEKQSSEDIDTLKLDREDLQIISIRRKDDNVGDEVRLEHKGLTMLKFHITGKKIEDVLLKADGRALEIISYTREYGNGPIEQFTQLYWLDLQTLMK